MEINMVATHLENQDMSVPAHYGPEENTPHDFQWMVEKQEDQHRHAKVQNLGSSSLLLIKFKKKHQFYESQSPFLNSKKKTQRERER